MTEEQARLKIKAAAYAVADELGPQKAMKLLSDVEIEMKRELWSPRHDHPR